MGVLKESMIKYMEIRGYAPHTIESYVNCVKIFAHHYNLSPLDTSTEQIELYLLHLRHIGRCDTTIYMHYSALKLFYRINNLKNKMPKIKFNRTKMKIPYIISQQKMLEIIDSCNSLKYKTIISLLYSSGIRISELRNLTVSDIDFDRKVLFIKNSKNNKNRYSIIGNKTALLLKQYINLYRPHKYLFYSESDLTLQICSDKIRLAFKKLVILNNLDPNRISLHTIRHCFATHILENGTDIFYIMKLLGHARIQTTMIYLHMNDNYLQSISSPIDTLDIPNKHIWEDKQNTFLPLSAVVYWCAPRKVDSLTMQLFPSVLHIQQGLHNLMLNAFVYDYRISQYIQTRQLLIHSLIYNCSDKSSRRSIY